MKTLIDTANMICCILSVITVIACAYLAVSIFIWIIRDLFSWLFHRNKETKEDNDGYDW